MYYNNYRLTTSVLPRVFLDKNIVGSTGVKLANVMVDLAPKQKGGKFIMYWLKTTFIIVYVVTTTSLEIHLVLDLLHLLNGVNDVNNAELIFEGTSLILLKLVFVMFVLPDILIDKLLR